MKKLGIMLVLVLAGSLVFAQTKEERKAAKQAKKEVRMQEDKANTAKLKSLVETKKFVLEANTLYDKTNTAYVISSNLNFVGFDGEFSTIQFSFNGLVGWNGVGGVTLDGSISKMEIKENKNGVGFTVNAVVQNKGGGLVTMLFRVSPNGLTKVSMNGSFGERLSLQGYLVPLDKSSVYKATPRF